jgi:hypothetical protein
MDIIEISARGETKPLTRREKMSENLKIVRNLADATIMLASRHASAEWKQWAIGWIAGDPPSQFAPSAPAEASAAIRGLCDEASRIADNFQAASSATDPNIVASRIADIFEQSAYAIGLAKRLEIH